MKSKKNNFSPSEIIKSMADRRSRLSQGIDKFPEILNEGNKTIVKAHIKTISAKAKEKIKPESPVGPAINNTIHTIGEKGGYLLNKMGSLVAEYAPQLHTYMLKIHKISTKLPVISPDILGIFAIGLLVAASMPEIFKGAPQANTKACPPKKRKISFRKIDSNLSRRS